VHQSKINEGQNNINEEEMTEANVTKAQGNSENYELTIMMMKCP